MHSSALCTVPHRSASTKLRVRVLAQLVLLRWLLCAAPLMRFGSRGDNMAAMNMKSDDVKYARMEGGSDTLYPGASTSDNVLRLGFIR